MSNPGLIKNYLASGPIAPHAIVKFAQEDGQVLAAAEGDIPVGVNEALGVQAGERVDIIRSGVADVVFGAAVSRGQFVTANAQGRAVPATPGAGQSVWALGYAEVNASEGDVASVMLNITLLRGV